MTIPISIKNRRTADAKTLCILMKVSDKFCASLHDAYGSPICVQEGGYVPKFMPGYHYGDYLILNIDLGTGLITNWGTPRPDEVARWVQKLIDEDHRG